MKEKFIDSTILDKAILFATNAHKNTERRGKGFPYIIHPLEVASIVSTMTSDQELMAAALLHDVVEDTEFTEEDIRREFGDRVATIVSNESDKKVEGKSLSESWKERKQAALDRLKSCSRDSKIVALGDKLSNMRTIYNDYLKIGDELWNRFHQNDPALHEWYYRGLANSLNDLRDEQPYKEFVELINKVFKK